MHSSDIAQTNRKQITTFLVLFRWITLLFSLIIILVQDYGRYNLDLKIGFFIMLVVYNSILALFYSKIVQVGVIRTILSVADMIFGVLVITLTGELTSPFFFYSLSSVFASTFFYQIRGAIAGIIIYIIGFFTFTLLFDLNNTTAINSMDSVMIFVIQGAFFAVLCGYPSILLRKLDKKSQCLEESRQNLLYLHEIASIMNVSQSTTDMMTKMLGISKEMSRGQEIFIYLLKGNKFQVYSTVSDSAHDSMNTMVAHYLEDWKETKCRNPYFDKGISIIPIVQGTRLEGVIHLKGIRNEEFTQEEKVLFSVISNMISTYLQNARLLYMIKEAMLISERRRIARDIHDGLAQSLFFFSAEIQSCRKLIEKRDRKVIEGKLLNLQKRMGESFQEVRKYIYNLRNDSACEDRVLETVGVYLKNIKRNFKLDIQYLPLIEKEINQEIGESLFCIIQEAINNIIKHANADEAKIYLEVRDEIALTIEDNGKGFDIEEMIEDDTGQTKFGIQSIRERVEYMGGDIQIKSSKGHGTSLHIVIPNNGGEEEYEADKIAYC